METRPKLVPLGATAARLQVPQKWLRGEAEAGRVPHLKAGQRLLFDIALVERELLKRARAQSDKRTGGNRR